MIRRAPGAIKIPLGKLIDVFSQYNLVRISSLSVLEGEGSLELVTSRPVLALSLSLTHTPLHVLHWVFLPPTQGRYYCMRWMMLGLHDRKSLSLKDVFLCDCVTVCVCQRK